MATAPAALSSEESRHTALRRVFCEPSAEPGWQVRASRPPGRSPPHPGPAATLASRSLPRPWCPAPSRSLCRDPKALWGWPSHASASVSLCVQTLGTSSGGPRGNERPPRPAPPPRTVAGQPLIEVNLPGQHHQLLEPEVRDPGLGILWLQVHLLLLGGGGLLPVGLGFGLPAKRSEAGVTAEAGVQAAGPAPGGTSGAAAPAAQVWAEAALCLWPPCPVRAQAWNQRHRGLAAHPRTGEWPYEPAPPHP